MPARWARAGHTGVRDDVVIERLTQADPRRVLDRRDLPQAPVGRLTVRDGRSTVRGGSIVQRITTLRLGPVMVNGKPIMTR